jgi:hypothetical protein
MVEHPADPDGVLGGATIAEPSDNVPVTDELSSRASSNLASRPSVGVGDCALIVTATRDKAANTGKRFTTGIMTDFHLSRDARNAKVFG